MLFFCHIAFLSIVSAVSFTITYKKNINTDNMQLVSKMLFIRTIDTKNPSGNLATYITFVTKSYISCLDESLFKAILRKLDFSREQFEKRLEDFSEGQKKKVLIAKNLCEQAHLYIWDEPLNYIDVLSRMQIEKLLLEYQPTILFVEHDSAFCSNIATKTVQL